MDKPHYSYCTIINESLYGNGDLIYKSDSGDFKAFSKELYKALEVSYPKFYKMDNLSKLGFLGAEYLFNHAHSDWDPDKTGILLFNSTSSLDTDLAHQSTLASGSGSPGIFVYTLPNIVIGEISIRHKIYSESCFFVLPQFDSEIILSQADVVFKETDLNCMLIGWVDFLKDKYEGHFYLIERVQMSSISAEDLTSLYQRNNK